MLPAARAGSARLKAMRMVLAMRSMVWKRPDSGAGFSGATTLPGGATMLMGR